MFEKIKGIKGKLTDWLERYAESKRMTGLALYGDKYQEYLDMKEKHQDKMRKKKASSESKTVDKHGKSKSPKSK
jgi:hypothetical protein